MENKDMVQGYIKSIDERISSLKDEIRQLENRKQKFETKLVFEAFEAKLRAVYFYQGLKLDQSQIDEMWRIELISIESSRQFSPEIMAKLKARKFVIGKGW